MDIRRSFVVLGLILCLWQTAVGAADNAGVMARLKEIEARTGGRLGVSAWQAGTERRIQCNSGERFAMASTFKLLLAAAVLQRVDEGKEQLERAIPYSVADLLEYAPVVKAHLPEGKMTVVALCAATIRYSDNSAANLLLATLGGPEGYTAFARSLGDEATRLDRREPELNSAIAGDPRDTTTPDAMLLSMRKVLLGDALKPESRARLEEWLVGNTTGGALIRAGLRNDWQVGDRTGRGGNASTNDIAIIRPPGGEAILLCVYATEGKVKPEERESAVADVTRLVAEALGK